MKKLLLFTLFFLFTAFVLVRSSGGGPLIPVFNITQEPDVIVQGSQGTALTVDLSFGDSEVKAWLEGLQAPYPLIFTDSAWMERSPELVKLMIDRNIPVGLLGTEGKRYEEEPKLLDEQIGVYEAHFGRKPLYFRTSDEEFPKALQKQLFEAEVNALGSTLRWDGGKLPKKREGLILSVQHHQEERTDLKKVSELLSSNEFLAIEDVLFGVETKERKFP
ncbi:hypothetical protein AV656_11835 [Bhargavaea cecembensis]|uniref:NodB homology domain-containing protein n=1 Tax=Bhargavaea cecembensis TaxID=394098 RepID=A0A161SJ54_9BACL|nr:hypothetical protein [Bhargavaea cecembensis]KZE37253.1 hypothetical protein AV656_11835 [Bhargavaea cecembensis]